MRTIKESILTSTKSGISNYGTPEQRECIEYFVDCISKMLNKKCLKYVRELQYGDGLFLLCLSYRYIVDDLTQNISSLVRTFFDDKKIKTKFGFKTITFKQDDGERQLFVYLTPKTCLHVRLYEKTKTNTKRDFVILLNSEKSEIGLTKYFGEKMQHLGK